MKQLAQLLIAIALLASLSGGGPLAVYARSINTKFRSHMIELPRAKPGQAASLWKIATHKQKVLLRWTCTPFESVTGEGLHDASIWLRPAARGEGDVHVIRPFDCTDLAENRKVASVVAKSRRSGVARIKLIVGVDDRFCPSGDYCTTVNLSVTAL